MTRKPEEYTIPLRMRPKAARSSPGNQNAQD
jgi:hypothetical protein